MVEIRSFNRDGKNCKGKNDYYLDFYRKKIFIECKY